MLNLKVGAMVKIREDLVDVADGHFCVVDPMTEYVGRKAVITGIKMGDIWDGEFVNKPVGYALDIDDGRWGWEETMFESVA